MLQMSHKVRDRSGAKRKFLEHVEGRERRRKGKEKRCAKITLTHLNKRTE